MAPSVRSGMQAGLSDRLPGLVHQSFHGVRTDRTVHSAIDGHPLRRNPDRHWPNPLHFRFATVNGNTHEKS